MFLQVYNVKFKWYSGIEMMTSCWYHRHLNNCYVCVRFWLEIQSSITRDDEERKNKTIKSTIPGRIESAISRFHDECDQQYNHLEL